MKSWVRVFGLQGNPMDTRVIKMNGSRVKCLSEESGLLMLSIELDALNSRHQKLWIELEPIVPLEISLIELESTRMKNSLL